MRIDRQMLRNMLALAAVFVVATWVSNGLLAGVDRVRLVWLPSGVAFAALALFGLRYWPGVVLAVALSELTRWFVQPEAMLLSIVHNTVPAVLAAAVYRHLQGRLRPHVAVYRVYALMLAAMVRNPIRMASSSSRQKGLMKEKRRIKVFIGVWNAGFYLPLSTSLA